MVSIKRVSYSYNSLLDQPYFLDLMVYKDGMTVVDLHKTFGTKEEFDEEINQVIPILEGDNNDSQS
jgi:hypothetical protein